MTLMNSSNAAALKMESFFEKLSQNNYPKTSSIYDLEALHNNNNNYIEDNYNFQNNLKRLNLVTLANNGDLFEESKSSLEHLVDLSFMDDALPNYSVQSSTSSMSNELGFGEKFSQFNLTDHPLSVVKNGNENYCQILSDNTNNNNNHNCNYGYTERMITRRGKDYYNQFGWNSVEKVPVKLHHLIMFNQKKMANDLENDLTTTIKTTNSADTIGTDQQRFNFKNTTKNNGNNLKARKKMECAFCKNLPDQQDNYKTHWLKDNEKRVVCPILRKYSCPICHNGGGDDAHTMRFCPKNRPVLAKEFYNSIARLNIKNSNKQKSFPFTPIINKCSNNLFENKINSFFNTGNQYI